jgi:hypothetical protein
MTEKLSISHIKGFLIFCSGARTDILYLPECKGDQDKQAGIGASVAITSFIAMLSGGYALFSVFQAFFPAAGIGLLWGAFILNADRSIIQGIRKPEGSFFARNNFPTIASLALRFFLAAGIALAVSVPMELKVFEREIATELQARKIKAKEDAEKAAQKAYPDITRLEQENSRLDKLIESGKNRQIKLTDNTISEGDGSAGTKKRGTGEVYKEKEKSRKRHENEFAKEKKTLEKQIDDNNTQLNVLRRKSARDIDEQALLAGESNGLASQLSALHKLSERDISVRNTTRAIMFLFVVIELSPILIKIFSPKSAYDSRLQLEEYKVNESWKLQMHQTGQSFEKASENYDESQLKQDEINREILDRAADKASQNEGIEMVIEEISSLFVHQAKQDMLKAFPLQSEWVHSHVEQEVERQIAKLNNDIVKSELIKYGAEVIITKSEERLLEELRRVQVQGN